jgi:anti-sigma-K factor RskA
MRRDHAAIEELLAVRALGGLDGDDAAALDELLASHGDCAECRRIRRDFEDVAGTLALSLDPVPLPSAVGERILAGTTRAATPPPRRGSPRWAMVAAAATLAVVVAAAGFLRPEPTEVTLAAGQTFTTFEGPPGGGTLTLAHTPGRPGAFFWGDDLPDPGRDRVFEIWMIRGDVPVSGGCVAPRPDGRLALYVDASLDDADVMAVTIEDASCPEAPTDDPVFVARLD